MAFIEYFVDVVETNWLIILSFILACWYFLHSTKKRPNSPPGPIGLPIVGVAPFIGRRPELTFQRWSKKYGDIVGFYMGQSYTVVLSSHEVISEAFVKYGKYFSHRPNNYMFTEVLKKKGVSFHDYTPTFVTERKFIVATLGKLGFGKTTMEAQIIDEARHLLEQFEDKDVELNQATKKKIFYSIGNVIAQMAIGKRFTNYQNPEFNAILNGWLGFLYKGSTAYLATMLIPWLKYVPPIRGNAISVKEGMEKLCHVIDKEIAEHEETLDAENPRDFIDEYLIQLKKDPSATEKPFSRELLTCTVRDFFGAGMETVTSTIVFTLLILANRPKMLKRIQERLDDVISGEGFPRMALREKIPFFHAFIVEVMRFRTVGPLSVPHCVSEDVEFRGYFIPKGTTIFPCIYAVHNDPYTWNKPEEFNPERHIDDSGKVSISKYFSPFGIGSRSCVGWRLAEMELFIFLSMILRRYDVIPTKATPQNWPWIEDDGNTTALTLCTPESASVTLRLRKE